MKFMIPIDLFEKFSSQDFISIVKAMNIDDTLAKRISLEMYSPYEGDRGISPSKKYIYIYIYI